MVPEVSRLPVDMLNHILYDKTVDVGRTSNKQKTIAKLQFFYISLIKV